MSALVYVRGSIERNSYAGNKSKTLKSIAAQTRIYQKNLKKYIKSETEKGNISTYKEFWIINAIFIEGKAETELTVSQVFVLDKAYKAEKKAYPKKSIIVMVATFTTFVLAVMAFLFFESFLRNLRST